jgi:tRNA threonylcarbamoyladenosine biosynthesis protein TsaB
MLVLALDTTTRGGSVALVRERRLVDLLTGNPEVTHAQRLPGDIVALLDRHRLTVHDVEVFAVASGPGSFTGLRIGIATIQGLAFATGTLVAPVSALDALGMIGAASRSGAASADPAFVGAVMDAQRSEVFSALYRGLETGASVPRAALEPGDVPLQAIEPPEVGDPRATFERWRSRLPRGAGCRLVGDGVLRYRREAQEVLGDHAVVCEALEPLAPTIGLLATDMARAGRAVAPHAVKPVYVRRPDAELARERRSSRQASSEREQPRNG